MLLRDRWTSSANGALGRHERHDSAGMRLVMHITAVIGAKADKPEAANHLLKTLRIMLAYAVTQGMLANNPAAGIKKYRSQGEGHHSWSESEIARFEQRHPIGSKARLALSLGLYTAQRKGDVLRMGWQHVSGDSIAVRQEKTDTALKIPMHPQLVAALASVPRGNLTFLVTEHGAPFTSNGFGNWWRDRCNEAGLPHCSFHGLRKAAATRLANAGCSVDQVKAITGHRSLAEVARYTRAADQQFFPWARSQPARCQGQPSPPVWRRLVALAGVGCDSFCGPLLIEPIERDAERT
jgi:integrase